jgi:CBS-domain-containing membrane protein
MKVQNIMTTGVQTCGPDTSLPQAVRLMRETRCGFLPVVDWRSGVAGAVTDRDICMALVNSARKPINISVREVMENNVHTCSPDDDIQAALTTMKRHRIRRLPVVDDHGRLQGVLSFDDVVLRALSPDAPSSAEIVDSLREILKRRDEAIMAEEAIW